MFITPETLNTINLEFTDYCNAACPMCSRFKWDGSLYKEKVNQNHNKLEVLQKRIPKKIIEQLKRFYSVGTYGDPVMNPECLQICQWIRELNPECAVELHSNGGARDETFWQELAKTGVSVRFNVDGLEDTNHLYRRKVDWRRLMQNIRAFIGAGGDAGWGFLVFKHNEHQIEDARALSKEMGFTWFGEYYSDRWRSSDWITGETMDVDKWPVEDYYLEKPTPQESRFYHEYTVGVYEEEQFNLDKKVVCQMASNTKYEIYIRANGNVQPCCMLGDLDVHESKILIKDPKSVNINHTDLVDILQGEFFRLLDKGINQGSKDRLKNCFYTCGVK
jgi:MoaA/NifB/PqqE/SkfB family radical SAM enzyme